jgi:hypothetical protein
VKRAALLLLVATSAAAEPRVALLATDPQGADTELYLVTAGGALPAPAARFEHLPGASVQAAVVPGTDTVVAVADRAPARDLSFASGLVRLAPGAPPWWLAGGVVVASRPLVAAGGRVFVVRGAPGADRGDEFRIDSFTVDEIDLDTGRPRMVHATSGYLVHLAGAYGGDLLLYRVAPEGADLVAQPIAGGTPRTLLASLPPYARDFTVDPSGALLYQNLAGRMWVIERLDLRARVALPIFMKREVASAPYVWPDGRLSLDADRRVLAVAGGHAALIVSGAGGRPVPLVVELATGVGRELPAPAGRRVTLAGFVP